MTDVERIISTFSPAEVVLFLEKGGTVPRIILSAVAKHHATIAAKLAAAAAKRQEWRDWRKAFTATAAPDDKPGRAPVRCRGSAVVSTRGHYWKNADAAAFALNVRRQRIVTGCTSPYRVRGLELYWLVQAPAHVRRLVAARRRQARAA